MLLLFSNCVKSKKILVSADDTRVKLHEFFNFAGCNVDSDSVVDFDQWIWITDCATITSDDTWHAFQSDQHFLHFAQFVLNTTQSQHHESSCMHL